MSPLLTHILAHALPIGVRVAGVLTFAPFFGNDALPARVKAGLVVVLTAMLYSVCPVPDLPWSVSGVLRLVLGEAAVGLLMGLSVQLVLEGAQIAGQLAGAQLGFSLAAIIDPLTNIETPVLATFYQTVALLIFLQLDVHHALLRAVVRSFAYFPAGSALVGLAAARGLLRVAAGMCVARRADRRAHPGRDPADRRDRGLSEQSLAATPGALHRYLRQKPGGLRSAGRAVAFGRVFRRTLRPASGWSERMLKLAH